MELAALVIPPLLTASMNTLMPKMLRIVGDMSSRSQDVEKDVKSLRAELKMMWSAVQQCSKSARSKDLGDVQATWINLVSDLAQRIEDCVDSYIYDDQTAKGVEYDKFAKKIKRFKVESDEIDKWRQRYSVDSPTRSEIPTTGESSSSGSCPPVLPSNLVGTEAPLRELLDLMEEEQAEDQPKKLKVISILGFDGLGKTAIAAQVYRANDVVGNYRAWVDAADKDPQQVLLEILQKLPQENEEPQQLQTQPWNATNAEQLCEEIRTCLQNNRYFIVIDDMRTCLWSTIKAAFPENSGRVLVTTSIESVAKDCCSETGCVYRMQGLDARFSETLFFRSAHVNQPSPDIKTSSEELRMKCDGLPLALISVGELLNLTKVGPAPTGDTCKDVCCHLGKHLEGADKNTALARMQKVLTRTYNCLAKDTAKACLLCIGMFPCGHLIRKKRLIRRWLAEGFFEKSPHYQHKAMDEAVENFKLLINYNIVQPIDVGNNDEVRSCQPPGMMVEFIRHRSMSENSTTLFCDKMRLQIPKNTRRISLHHRSSPDVQEAGCELDLVRSLTIFGKASQDILKFDKYRLLRVLDLEDCEDLTNDHLNDICNLFLLNYLSLGGSVTALPRDIARLVYLETLDVRRANVEVTIPVDVMMLKSLIRLFGKFKLLGNVSNEISEFFESGKSIMEILAGLVVTDGNDGFLQLLEHMNNLRKVKIWCNDLPDSSKLSSALQKYIENSNQDNPRSLSLEFDASFKDVSQLSRGNFHITSLKLRGNFSELPHFVALLVNLRELCLSSITTLKGSLLKILSNLSCLVYLKIVAKELEAFVLSDGTKFESLQRLCFKVQGSTLLQIEGNPLPQLVSFQLLYNNMDNLPLINIERVECLRELTLYCIDNAESRRTWEDAAKRHPNRPRVFFVQKEGGQEEAEYVMPEEQSSQGGQEEAESVMPAEQSSQRLNRRTEDRQAMPECKNSRFKMKLPKFLRRNKGRTRSSATVGTNKGRRDIIIHEATGVHAEAPGSTADGCATPHPASCPTEDPVDESISNR